MDSLDWRLIEELERDGRVSYAALGSRVGLSKSPCWMRVQQLEKNGFIEGYRAQLDPEKLGLTVESFVNVQILMDCHTDFEKAALDHPAIVECFTTAGETDYLLRVMAVSISHLDDLLRQDLSKLPGVQRLASTVCLKTIKRSGHLARWAIENQSSSAGKQA
ncbi:MAG: Lrp/AsnC family transcriptional regulator [Pacificimonas sp.]|nr:Lrp/AsnC family transcriptional regulator [Pacificimonas sp.]